MSKKLLKSVLSVLLVLTLTVGMFACAVSVSAATYEPVINGFSSDAWTVGSNGSINENGEFVGNYASPYWLPTSIVSNESYDLSAGFNFSSLINWTVPQDNTATNGGYGWADSSFARITIGNISVLMIHKSGNRAYTVDIRYTDEPDTLASAGHIIQNGNSYGDGSAWNSYGTRLGYKFLVGYNDSNHVENVHMYTNGVWSINYDGTNLTVSLDATAGETYDQTFTYDISEYVSVTDFKSSKIVMERDNVIFKESTALSSYTVMDDIYLEKNTEVGCTHEIVNNVVDATCTHMGYSYDSCSKCDAVWPSTLTSKATGHNLTINGDTVTCADCDYTLTYSGEAQTIDFRTNDYTGVTGYLDLPAAAFVGDTINHPDYKRGESEGWAGSNKFTFYDDNAQPVADPTPMYRWHVYYEGTAESNRVTEEFNADTNRAQTYTFDKAGTYYIRGCLNNTTYYENVGTIEVYDVPLSCEHVWNDGVINPAPTCVAEGTKTYTCTLCSETKTETIAATGVHNYVDGACSVCNATDPSVANYVAQNGENYYETLQAAHDAATAGDTIKLIGNVDTYLNVTKNITLDLNGYTLTNRDSGSDTITLASGDITITDSVGTGQVISDYDTGSSMEPTLIWSKGNGKKAVIYGGTFTISENNNTNGNIVFAANMDIYGGTFKHTATQSNGLFNSGYTVNIYGGNFDENTKTPAEGYAYKAADNGTFDVVAHEHSYAEIGTSEATCTHMGYIKRQCTADDGAICDEVETVLTSKATGHNLTINGDTVTCADCDYTLTYSGTAQTIDFRTNDYTGVTGYLDLPAAAFVGDTINHPDFLRGQAEGWHGDHKFTFYDASGNVLGTNPMYSWGVYYEGFNDSNRVAGMFNCDTNTAQTYTFDKAGTYYIRGYLNNTSYWDNVATIEVYDVPVAEEVTVTFTNRNGATVNTMTANAGGTITLPALPTCYGYTCNGWVVNGETKAAGDEITVTEDMTIAADFTKNADLYTVTVTGAETDVSGSYNYNDKITVKFNSASLDEGDYFCGWSNGKTIVSYSETYVFFVGADVTLQAVIEQTEATVQPIVAVTDVAVISGGAKVSFLTERHLASEYTLVESGVLYTKDETIANADAMILGSTAKQKAATNKLNNGQFRMTVGSADGSAITVYLRAYMTYTDAEGTQYTVYSDVYSGTTVATVQ